MAHWYTRETNGTCSRFDDTHPRWGHLPGWPTIKSGAPAKRINDKLRLSMGLYPGVTDILGHIGQKNMLLRWAGNLGIQAGFETAAKGHGPEASEGIAKGRLTELMDQAATRGTRMHEVIETYLSKGLLPDDDPVASEAALQASAHLEKLGLEGEKEWVFCKEYTDYSRVHHIDEFLVGPVNLVMKWAGTVDFKGSNENAIIDFKTVEDDSGRAVRETEHAQIAAYAMGAYGEMPDIAQNIYLSRSSGKIVNVVEWTREDMEKGWALFCLAHRVFTMMVGG